MIRETFIATSDTHIVRLPKDWIGEKVTLVYDKEIALNVEKERSVYKASDAFKNARIDLSTFKFNRDEANNYE